MYAAIAPVARVSCNYLCQGLEAPKIGQGLEGPQIDDLEPWPLKWILDNIDNYNYGQHVKLLTFTYWLLILCYIRIFSCSAINEITKCALIEHDINWKRQKLITHLLFLSPPRPLLLLGHCWSSWRSSGNDSIYWFTGLAPMTELYKFLAISFQIVPVEVFSSAAA